ncbi:hypothetical protein CYMTET_27307, partial [Cymbomonas tetramitiformis]
FAAIAGPLRTVPHEVLEATRELTEISLLEEGAGASPNPTFAVVSEWVLRGNWTSARAIAKKRMKAVKAWGGPTGTVILTHAELMKLLDEAVAKATAAAGGALSTPAGGAGTSGVEGQYRRALAASQALEAHSFPELTWARPMLEEEACDIDELPAGEEASLEDWCVLVHLLRVRVTEMQEFVRGKEPGAVFEDILDDTFARKRPRSPSPPAVGKRMHVDPGVPTGAGSPGVALTSGRRGELAAAAAGLRTVTEEQLQQALMGTLAPESIPKPAARNLDAQQAKLVLGEDGRSLQWEAANKRT